MEQEESLQLDLGKIDFTPDWVKRGAGVSVGKEVRRAEREEREGGKASGPRNVRAPFERKPGLGGGDRGGERKPFKKSFDRPPRRFQEPPRPLEAEVKVLPESKALGTIIRKIQSDYHAYKLKDLAYFFLDNPQSVLLRITAKNPAETTFHQCKACGFASLDRDEVIAHALNAHFGDYYEAREIECEPPKGNFNCVAKCGLSGVLLGPPNIHEFNAIVKEMIRTRYPDMTEAQYRSHIEMVREADAIEEWRKSAVRKTVYFVKGEADKEGAPSISREQAEGEFRRNILASMVESPKTLTLTADVALKTTCRPLLWAIRDALEAENRAPYGMCFALRGAFHHRKLNFFRVNDNRGQEFVCSIEFKEFDAEHAIPELAALAQKIAENPCLSKGELLSTPEQEQHLTWLVSTGHAVAFTNGVFSAVEKFPKYGPQWRRKHGAPALKAGAAAEMKPAAEEKPAEVAPAPAAAEEKPAEVASAETAPAENAPVETAATATNEEVKGDESSAVVA